MSSNPDFDRWYAAKSARFLVEPSHRLETFGNTLVNYHLVSELDDHPGKVRIREGRLEAHQPLVITPNFSPLEIEGLGDEAKAYLEFLKENEKNLRILQYGYHLKSDNFSEQIVTDRLSVVTERVKDEVVASNDKFAAVVQCVDEPWDVALVELWLREVNRSAKGNIDELQKNGKLFCHGKTDEDHCDCEPEGRRRQDHDRREPRRGAFGAQAGGPGRGPRSAGACDARAGA